MAEQDEEQLEQPELPPADGVEGASADSGDAAPTDAVEASDEGGVPNADSRVGVPVSEFSAGMRAIERGRN